MKPDILVSVIVPTYNHEKYIGQCLESIVSQKTIFDFEIIVGDDCSTDSTREKIKSVSDRFPGKFKLLFHERNLGPLKYPGKNNSIECLRAASGKYLAFCEGDDYWTDNSKLQKQVDFLENNPDYNISFHQVAIDNEDKNHDYQKPEKFNSDTSTIEDLFRTGNIIHTATCVLRNPFVYDFPEWFYKMSAGDYAIYILSLKDKKIKFFPDIMAVYRIHGAGTWGAKSRVNNYLHEIESFKVLYKVFKKYQPLIKHSIYNRYLFIAGYYRRNGEAGQTLRFELKTVLFCIAYFYKPNRNHVGLAIDVVKDFLKHKIKPA